MRPDAPVPSAFAPGPRIDTAPPRPLHYPGKDPALAVLSERPLVAEVPPHGLDAPTTPTAGFFVRNNGLVPEPTPDPDAWEIVIDGEVDRPVTITLGALKDAFPVVTREMVLECGGNGRSAFFPPTKGVPWTNGGVSCAAWTGVRLRDVLELAGIRPTARFTAHYGADEGLSSDPALQPLSRGVPIEKALDESNLLAWAMNGELLPLLHGFPLRLVIGGWPGSVSTKWLKRIWIRDRVHDGRGMGGTSYRIPTRPLAPGSRSDGSDFVDLESMPVRSVITAPVTGARLAAGTRAIPLRGVAWAGDHTVARVDLSSDNGATWHQAVLAPPRNRYDWQRWHLDLPVMADGYYEICARATDSQGIMQPHAAANWNPQGYGANPMHRIAVTVG